MGSHWDAGNENKHLQRSHVLAGPENAEVAAEDLHTAIRSLDSLIGRVDVEQVLDEIFASFCLGK